jgi:hypothetical protein
MVTDPRATLGAHELRALKLPVPVTVRADGAGQPRSVRRDDWSAPREVARLEERWRVDDEWWRERPVARLYYHVLLADGALLTLYHDLVDDRWYEQRYGRWKPPRQPVRPRPGRAARRPARGA